MVSVSEAQLLDLQAMAFLRRGGVRQVLRIPPVRHRTRNWYLALDGRFAEEGEDPAQVILAVATMATHWKSGPVAVSSSASAASRRDLEAMRRLRDGEVTQVVWLADPGRGQGPAFLATSTRGEAEAADPADAMIVAASRAVARRSRRR